jgi:hypothetical protein
MHKLFPANSASIPGIKEKKNLALESCLLIHPLGRRFQHKSPRIFRYIYQEALLPYMILRFGQKIRFQLKCPETASMTVRSMENYLGSDCWMPEV